MDKYSWNLGNVQIKHGYPVDNPTQYLPSIHGISTQYPAVIHTYTVQEHRFLFQLPLILLTFRHRRHSCCQMKFFRANAACDGVIMDTNRVEEIDVTLLQHKLNTLPHH